MRTFRIAVSALALVAVAAPAASAGNQCEPYVYYEQVGPVAVPVVTVVC
ncbi:MAG TPA: hypothetical protein VNQ77_03175 [Frankiaceae bacterium]|nr:hypothetical protein [Frankiaceae bacterium]